MISIVIPLYNKAGQISRTIQTVAAQTYQDFEVVVVDDGSTDGSAAVVESVDDPRIRLVRQANAGVSAARNRGIAEARGEYVAFLDADDEWRPEYLATQASLTEKYPECAVFATDYVCVAPDGTERQAVINRLPFTGEDGVLSNYFEVAAVSSPPLWTSAVMVRKDAIESIGGFPRGIKSGEDLLTWARLACRYPIAYSRRALAIFNIDGYDVKDRPKRIPAEDDVVTRELKALEDEYHTPGLRKYRALWHKMRAAIYMRLRMRAKSISECAKAIKLNPLNYKLYAFVVLNLLPSKLQPF